MRVAGIPLGVGKKNFDPSLTLALLHFDGADGSTTFIDSSPYNRTVTMTGTPTISTAQPRFGSSSLYLPASTSCISLPSAATIFNNSDFCIEGYYYCITKGLYGGIMGHYGGSSTNTGFSIEWAYGSDKVRLLSGYAGFGVWNLDVTSTIDFPLNVYTHIALVRIGQNLRLYIGGQIAIDVNSPFALWADPALAYKFNIGAADSNNRFGVGYIDEFRIRKEAVYTGNFTPPTAPFTY